MLDAPFAFDAPHAFNSIGFVPMLDTANSSVSAHSEAAREAARKRRKVDEDVVVEDGFRSIDAAAAAAPTDDAGGPTRLTSSRTSCVHEVATPKDWKGDVDALRAPTFDGVPAKAYPFELDAFQKTATAVLERNESVLVAAHTSAGKTVVAEYAIAMAFRDKQRVIYTSPLKALSNQKFRELSEEFGDVGLMTGDASINPNSTCIVMTTEVLRSMLYRGGDVIREVKWIIFDEVHYMRDRERGVVWEESIIFAPKDARLVFLSATLPNALEFAQWVTSLHSHPCHVVYTDHRPTPLQHYAFPKGGSGLHLVVNEQSQFKSENFTRLQQAIAAGAERSGGSGGGSGRGGGRGRGRGGGGGRGGERGGGPMGDADILRIVRMVKEKTFFPVIVFSFSRRECEEYARSVAKLNFNTPEEAEQIREVYNAALLNLSEEDRQLTAVQAILPLLEAGIGIHHSGLLPVLKELIEILFGESLIKCLFATETFAMGLNMPARTVIFTAVKKFDGTDMRVLAPGEYTQMSGRAGRRGKDDRGICIVMCDERMEEHSMKEMILGKPQPLNSEFKLSYYSILNLLKRATGTVDAEYVIARSFHQFQHAKQVPEMKARLAEVQEQASKIKAVGSDDIQEYIKLRREYRQAEQSVMRTMLEPSLCLRFFSAGRLVRIRDGDTNWGWGVVVHVLPVKDAQGATVYVLDCLLRCGPGAAEGNLVPASEKDAKSNSTEIVPVGIHLVDAISAMRLTLPDDLRTPQARESVWLAVETVTQKLQAKGQSIPLIDPVEDMGITDVKFVQTYKSLGALRKKFQSHALYSEADAQKNSELTAKIDIFEQKSNLLATAAELKEKIQSSELTKFRDDLKARSKVLKKLGHVDKEGVVLTKGRAACEIDTADELLVTELMFNGVFHGLNPHELVALASCFMPVEKSNTTSLDKSAKALAKPLKALQDAAREIASVQKECRIEIEVEDFVESFKPTMVEIVYCWAKGEPFSEIVKKTDLFEGTIIRAMRRLDELMMELHRACIAVGDTELAEKFEKGAESLRHGIVFADSLYT